MKLSTTLSKEPVTGKEFTDFPTKELRYFQVLIGSSGSCMQWSINQFFLWIPDIIINIDLKTCLTLESVQEYVSNFIKSFS